MKKGQPILFKKSKKTNEQTVWLGIPEEETLKAWQIHVKMFNNITSNWGNATLIFILYIWQKKKMKKNW